MIMTVRSKCSIGSHLNVLVKLEKKKSYSCFADTEVVLYYACISHYVFNTYKNFWVQESSDTKE